MNLLKKFLIPILFSFTVPFVCVACELPSLDPVEDQRRVETLWRVDSPNHDLKRTALVVTSVEESVNDFVLLDDQNNELLRRRNISVGLIHPSPVFRPDGKIVAIAVANEYEHNWNIEFFNTETGDFISYVNDINPNKSIFFIHGAINKAIVHDASSGEAIVLDCSDLEPLLLPCLTKKLYGVKFLTFWGPGSTQAHFAVGVHYSEDGTCQFFPVPFSEER